MTTFFRIQNPNITLEQMQQFTSADGGDDLGKEVGGICACDSVASLLNNTAFSTKWGLEVVVFKAQKLGAIYDGWRVYPTRIVDRIDAGEFFALSKDGDSKIYEYENQ